MRRLGFIAHPFTIANLREMDGLLGYIPEVVLEKVARYFPPARSKLVFDIQSTDGTAEGWCITCPLTVEHVLTLPRGFIISRILQASRVAKRLGAEVIGLGGYFSSVDGAVETVRQGLGIPVTTGSSCTLLAVTEGIARMVKNASSDLTVSILGATTDIGARCAGLLAENVKALTLVDKNAEKVERLASKIMEDTGLAPRILGDHKKALSSGGVIVICSCSSLRHLAGWDPNPGTMVFDLSRLRPIQKQSEKQDALDGLRLLALARRRSDVLIVQEGMVSVAGLKAEALPAALAGTFLLSITGSRANSVSEIGLRADDMQRVRRLASRQGVEVVGFSSFGRMIPILEDQV